MNTDNNQEENSLQQSGSRIKLPYLCGAASIAGLAFLLTVYSPGGGPFVILVFLALLFALFISLTYILLQNTTRVLSRVHFSTIRMLYTSVVIATGGIFLVGLQTLRQLQPVDIILTLLFEIVLNFYLLRRF